MTIQYLNPLARGWERMKIALFQPFDLKKWFVVGFTAFLAGLTDWHSGGGSGAKGRGRIDWDDVVYFPDRAWEWLRDNPGWFTLIIFGVFFIFILMVLFTWLSSRGKFMFLDNMIHNRAQVVKPWYEYRAEGNSLFLWSFLFGILVFAIIVLYFIQCYSVLRDLYESRVNVTILLMPAILMLLGFFGILLLAGYIDLLLCDFVVPLMYKYRINTIKAWLQFFPLFSAHFFHFIGYGFVVLFVIILVVIGIVFAGLLTCCIGFVLLLIPYINAVVLLPISYTLRAFSVEFLEQFGPAYYIFPRPAAGPLDEEMKP